MSNNHKRNSQPSTLERRQMPPRRFRHGRVIVGQPPYGHEDGRPSPFVKKWRTVEVDDVTGELRVVHHQRLMSEDEVREARDGVLRAARSTVWYGEKNVPEGMAPRGKGGK